jgi:hypothetical protein
MARRLRALVVPTCRVCGCSQYDACDHPAHGSCWWVEVDLCSHCDMIAKGEIDRGDVEQPADRRAPGNRR